ncbi:MAG: mannose-6-phosphate isomerase, partial [Kiritimatiellae bacterium]|nr:mannose-6-phosphate isomerase [Kiritimatiellia bacterium]
MKLEPNLHTLVWGTESWEVSAHPTTPSVIADGPMKGRTLAEMKPDFPLLVKVIDAKTRLSVQVHPNERTAP